MHTVTQIGLGAAVGEVVLGRQVGRCPKYKKNIQALLFEILRDARENGYLSQVPALIPIKLDQKKIKYLDADTQAAVLEKIPVRHRPIYVFLLQRAVESLRPVHYGKLTCSVIASS